MASCSLPTWPTQLSNLVQGCASWTARKGWWGSEALPKGPRRGGTEQEG